MVFSKTLKEICSFVFLYYLKKYIYFNKKSGRLRDTEKGLVVAKGKGLERVVREGGKKGLRGRIIHNLNRGRPLGW